MRDLVLLVVKEILEYLLLFRFVISLAHKALLAAHLIFAQDCTSYDLL